MDRASGFVLDRSRSVPLHERRTNGFPAPPPIQVPLQNCVIALHMTDGNNENHEDSSNFLMNRWKAADTLEIRLDATVAMCHTLARFLSYDMTLTPKETPSWEVADIVMLINTFTSALVLALFWTVAGLITNLFEASDKTDWSKVTLTALLAAPSWLFLELMLGWPAAEGAADERILLGTLGVWGTMCLGRVVSSLWL